MMREGVWWQMAGRKYIQVAIIVILLVSLLAAGCGQQPEDGNEESKAAPVEVVKAQKGSLVETSVVTGKLEALASSGVVPSGQGGKVESVNADVGDWVKKGQTLVVLENTLLSSAVRQAEQGVVQAQSALEIAKIDYEQAKVNYERGKTLFEQGAISKAGQQGFETAYEIPYKKAKQNFEKNRPAALASAEAGLAQARENYNNSFIKAPIAGVVTDVNVDPGEMASAAVPVVAVANLSTVVVKAAVAEDLVNKLKKGNEVQVNVSAVSAEPFKGKITSIAPAADKSTKAFPVEVQLGNPDGKLKPGMFAEINLTQEHPDSIVVPKEAIVGSGGDYAVWVVEEGKAVRRDVKLGPDNGKDVAVLTGLKEGEQVVAVGNGALRDGMQVEIKKQEK